MVKMVSLDEFLSTGFKKEKNTYFIRKGRVKHKGTMAIACLSNATSSNEMYYVGMMYLPGSWSFLQTDFRKPTVMEQHTKTTVSMLSGKSDWKITKFLIPLLNSIGSTGQTNT